ncbi:MAG: hypothetical protein QM760_04290 [Nibricoccus sp.]
MKSIRLFSLVLFAAILSGCATQRVVVIDTLNRPVSGAIVEPISLSINYAKLTTDEKGKASLPRVIQKVEWVSVTKEGFKPSGHVPVGSGSPVVIILDPTK